MMTRLNPEQTKRAQRLRAIRPCVVNGADVVRRTEERIKWYRKVTKEMKKLNVPREGISEFCDIAGVPKK